MAPGSGLPVLAGGALTERAGRQAPCSCGGGGAAGTYRRGAAPAGGRATSAPALARVLAVAGVQEVRCRFTLLDMSERHNMACAPRHPPSSAQRAAVRRSFPRTSSGAGRTGRRACQASALCRTCARTLSGALRAQAATAGGPGRCPHAAAIMPRLLAWAAWPQLLQHRHKPRCRTHPISRGCALGQAVLPDRV